jgi:hypothetical protein
MAKKTYREKSCDLTCLSKNVDTWFADRGYETQTTSNPDSWLVQARKTETWRKALGASRAFSVVIQGQPKEFSVDVGTGEWASNLTAGGVAAILTGGVSLIGSGVATAWSKKIESDLWAYIDNRVLFGEKAKSAQEMAVIEAQTIMQSKLKQLQDALVSGIIDEATYNAKRAEIEAQTKVQKQDVELEGKLEKLKRAFDAGILNQAEFEMKKAELMRQSASSEADTKVAQLKAALDAGVLSQEEFEQKKALIEKELGLASKLKQLENARDAGIITAEEFEGKKMALLSGL